jgi:predicted MFS family arabinose efflux permease
MLIPLTYPLVSTSAVTPHRIHTTVILAVLATGGLASAMLSSAVIPALPAIQHALHMYGKERLLVVTLALLAFGTAVSALSTSLVPMVVGRVI